LFGLIDFTDLDKQLSLKHLQFFFPQPWIVHFGLLNFYTISSYSCFDK